jgi:hypothetical protein
VFRVTAVGIFLMSLAPGPAASPSKSLRAAEPADRAPDENPPVKFRWTGPSRDNHRYLTDLREAQGELDRFKSDRDWRWGFRQVVGTQYSFIGRYRKALECFDEDGDEAPPNRALKLSGYEPRDAIETILELADRRQAIMVNEAHHVPLHRAFTIQLLEGLYRRGFRYFAAETLTAKDKALRARGYPTLDSGSLLHEPLYADLVRIAMQLGYQIVPYEFEEAKGKRIGEPASDDENFVATQNAREGGQARNLKDRIFSHDPKAKILVHAGYAHIAKKPATWESEGQKREVRFMAVNFEKLTGIEPLTIDQTLMTERGKAEKECSEYRAAIEQGLLNDKAVVLRQRVGSDFYSEVGYDLVVFHPRTHYENGRPTWLALGGRRKAHSVQGEVRPAEGASYLAQAFYAQEQGAEAVPVDQLEYGADEPVPTLWLPSGEFRIRIIDESGKTLHEYSTTSGSS